MPQQNLTEILQTALDLNLGQVELLRQKEEELISRIKQLSLTEIASLSHSEGEESVVVSRRSSDSKYSQPTNRNLFYSYTPGSGRPRESTASAMGGVDANIGKEVLLTYKIIENGIQITVNSQRPPTAITGSQGDHVTAYATFLQAVCSLMDGEDVYEAPEILYNAIKCFISDDGKLKAFEKMFLEKKQEVERKFFPRENRKRLTYELRELNNLRKDIDEVKNSRLSRILKSLVGRDESKVIDVDSLKEAIKSGNQVLFAQFVVEIGEQLISSYNREETAALPKLNSNHDAQEGNRIKKAMRSLRLINKVFELKEKLSTFEGDISDEKPLINNFRNDCKNIIKASSGATNDSTINRLFNECVECCNLNFDLTKTEDECIKSDIINMNIDKIRSNDIGILFNDLFDFKESKVDVADRFDDDGTIKDDRVVFKDPFAILCDVTERHIKFMFTAFKHLEVLDLPQKENMVKGFLSCVIASPSKDNNYQGWNKYKIVDAEKISQLSEDILFNKIREKLFFAIQKTSNLRVN